ncbi:MAG: DUF2066 domain-containing protein [Pseudomonadota bacterium]|nr:DUF2066 domain-containing protein [Pseudomonadota bacterium]
MAERPQPSFPPLKACSIGLLAVLVAAFYGAVPPQTAAAQDLYAVSDIAVDETASNEVQAKQDGVAKAKRAAFQEMMTRLTLAGEAPPTPDDERLEFLIRDMSFTSEKFGGGRYIATLTVRFQQDEVNRYLQRSGTAYLANPSPLTVVLPIFRDESGDQLWSDVNPWLDAWWRLEEKGQVVPFTVPLGDLGDIGAIDAKRAVNVDATGINAIAGRYRAGAVAIPIATFAAEGGILVELATFGAGWPAQPDLLRFPEEALNDRAAILLTEEQARKGQTGEIDPTERAAQLYAAASLTLEAMEARWKGENILRFDQAASKMMARVGLNGLEEWLKVRASLAEVAPIKSWRLSELATSHAVLEIDYIGDTDRLSRAFARVALVLAPGTDGETWTLTRR